MNSISHTPICDLRPHYVFAFHTESREFWDCKTLIYYSRKDKYLHYEHTGSKYSYICDDFKDMVCVFAIADEDINALQEVFGLMIDAYNTYIKRGGERWLLCDGSTCTVICGRKRIHFMWPGQDPFESFCNMVYQTLSITEEREKPDYEELRKLLPVVKEKLVNFLNETDC